MRDEFQFIADLKQKYGLARVGDDCAVLPMDEQSDLCVTADMLVENVDFRLSWTTPEALGHKALAVSLSDIAAMGAAAMWAMVSLAVPDDLWHSGSVDKFYQGWFELAREHGVELVGGDVSRTGGPLVIDSIVGGSVPRGKALLRSGSAPGDSIWVSGTLGGAAGGLALLETSSDAIDIATDLTARQLRPRPQLALAKLLRERGIVGAMIDVSDGLSSDLGHICEASGVGARIYADKIPVDVHVSAWFDAERCFDMATNGGEDFELLFTSPSGQIRVPDLHQITRIGEITDAVGVLEIVTGGVTVPIVPKGYRHF